MRLAFESYGYGHYVETLDGMQAISHGGQGYGVMTHYHAIPEMGEGIVILTNSQRSWPMIAFLLDDWARWLGTSSPGMTVMIYGDILLWMVVGVLILLSAWILWGFFEHLISGKKAICIFSKKQRWTRTGKGIVSVALLGLLVWAINQDYLFLTSVFPVAAKAFGYALFGFAWALLLTAFLVKKGQAPSQESIS